MGPAWRKRSSMVDHSTADRLAIRGAPEFRRQWRPGSSRRCGPDRLKTSSRSSLIRTMARTMFARRDQALMDGRAGARVKPAARAVRDHDLRRAAETPAR